MRLKICREAGKWQFNARGDVEKFKGEYKNIIKGFNRTLTIAKPTEIIEVMTQLEGIWVQLLKEGTGITQY